MPQIDATSDERTANNAVRHEYRVLSETEKQSMLSIKDLGAEFLNRIAGLDASRELSIARTKVEEAVMWAVRHITAVLFLAALVVAVVLPPVAHAAEGTVTVPVGDWIVQATSSLASLAVTALMWVAARYLPTWIRMQLTEQLLTRAVDYALAVVAGAAKGKVLEVHVASAVLREAAAYAVKHAPDTARWIGDTLEPKLIARLSAAGALPEVGRPIGSAVATE
jgi:DNA-directed RNA polymerase subunit H (RpoH/RPB5)